MNAIAENMETQSDDNNVTNFPPDGVTGRG
jgi:hypothetical protein